MKETTEIADLLKKFFEGDLTHQEYKNLIEWSKKHHEFGDILKVVALKEGVYSDIIDWMHLNFTDLDDWEERLIYKINETQKCDNETPSINYNTITISKVYLLVASVLLFFLLPIKNSGLHPILSFPSAEIINKHIDSGHLQLKLSSGEEIMLLNDKKGLIISDSIKYSDGTSIINPKDLPGLSASLIVPNGQKYKIDFSDGSRVWLNASTSLKYPLKFSGDLREVELSGEAYFEIKHHNKLNKDGTKSKIPFVVLANGQEIIVTGTKFNVKAYPNEGNQRTSLVEGGVKIRANAGEVLELKPGQEGELKHGYLSKKTFDMQATLAWLNNQFVFDESSLEEALNELSRWYDFDVKYPHGIPDKRVYAIFDRKTSLNQMLTILKLANIKFTFSDGTLKKQLIILEK